MKSNENSPVNEWNAPTERLGYLNGGPLDSLLAQLSRAGPAISAQTDNDILMSAKPDLSGESETPSNS